MPALATQYSIGQYSIDSGDAWGSVEPRTWKTNGEVIGCISAHGHSSLTHAALILLVDAHFLGDAGMEVARSGRVVMSADFQDNSWGNDNAILSVRAAYNWLTGYLGAEPGKVHLLGTSMGFLTVCNFAKWVLDGGPQKSGVDPPDTEINAIAGLVPATSLDGIHDRDYAGYASEIETAYGGLSAYNSALATHDPTAYGAADLSDTPIKLWYSTDDPATLPAEVTTFGTAVGAEMQSIGAHGHAYVGTNLLEIVDFFNEHP